MFTLQNEWDLTGTYAWYVYICKRVVLYIYIYIFFFTLKTCIVILPSKEYLLKLFCLLLLYAIKVKLSHYHHVGAKGERSYSFYSFLISAQHGLSGQHHALAMLYRLGIDPQYPLNKRLGGPQSCSGHRLEEKSFASVGNRTSVIQAVIRHYTD
jgi:hypothetical protein